MILSICIYTGNIRDRKQLLKCDGISDSNQ